MEKEKIKQIADSLSGLSYREFLEVTNAIAAAYRVTKKELTPQEISSAIKYVH